MSLAFTNDEHDLRHSHILRCSQMHLSRLPARSILVPTFGTAIERRSSEFDPTVNCRDFTLSSKDLHSSLGFLHELDTDSLSRDSGG